MSVEMAPEAPTHYDTSADVSEVKAPEGAPEKFKSLREAAQYMAAARNKKPADESPSASNDEIRGKMGDIGAEPVSTEEVDADSQPETTGETQEVDHEAGSSEDEAPPSVDPPRSWGREQREVWNKLDPSIQEYLLEQDSQTSSAVKKSLNEAAEKQRALDARLQEAEQMKAQYAQAAEYTMQLAQAAVGDEAFADIKTPADELRLAKEDWPRYNEYLARSRIAESAQRQYQAIHAQQQQEQSQHWQNFAQQQDAQFSEKVTDAKDLTQAAVKMLKDVGFTDHEMGTLWNTYAWRDHRMQEVFADAARYRTAKEKTRAAPSKPVPPVSQRPGVAQGANAVRETQLKTLEQKADRTGSVKDVFALYSAKKAGSRRK